MNKHITRCGCCGIDVCTTIEDNDPICSVCFQWAQRLEHEQLEKEVFNQVAKVWDALETLGVEVETLDAHYQDTPKRMKRIEPLLDLSMIVYKAQECIERLSL